MKPKYQLEDYIYEVETRPPESRPAESSDSASDLWARLQQKEADLVLAAELGKALLEKNEELAKEQKKLVDEYSAKLEALEQDKHILRRKLSTVQGEGEARALELQGDLQSLTSRLEHKEVSVRQAEREKAALITELTAQNARLTVQLQEAAQAESQLSAQLQGLRDQYSLRSTSLQDHVSSLESLKDELRLISDKKTELERRLAASISERENLTSALEEESDRIMALERYSREQDMKYQNTMKEMDRLQRENDTLSERLESVEAGSPNGEGRLTSGPRSLLCEMECEESGIDGGFMGMDSATELGGLGGEAVQVYKKIKALVQQLKYGLDDDSGLHSDLSLDSPMEPAQGSTLPPGVLLELTTDLVRLVSGLDATRCKALLEQAHNTVQDRDQEVQMKQETICDLQAKLSVCDVELRSAMEERDRARHDASHSSLQQDEIVAQAREVRDAAVARRTKAEVDLARTRVELLQANSQLLEAIQQKVELSQQLEQWQSDMHELIDEQMKNKLMSEHSRHVAAAVQSTTGAKKPNRLFTLFQR